MSAGKTLAQATTETAARVPRRTEPEHPSAVAALRLLALTGARLSEVLGLTWKMFDSSERVLRLPDSKTGAKVIPLGTPALQVIDAQRVRREDGNPFIFPGNTAGKPLADLQKPWQRVRGVAGLADARIHDLRHTLASHAVMRGMSLVMVGKILGHRSSATTARYAHFAADPVRQAAEAASSPLADLLRPPRRDAEPLLRRAGVKAKMGRQTERG